MAEEEGNGAGEDSGREAVLRRDVDYEVTKAVLDAMSVSTETILLTEFDKILKDEKLMRAVKDNLMSYISTLALLSLALKDESKENISTVMASVGLEFDENILRGIPTTYLRNRLVYVYAFYFLTINGRETSEENIRAVTSALGMEFDKDTFKESLDLICTNTKCSRIEL